MFSLLALLWLPMPSEPAADRLAAAPAIAARIDGFAEKHWTEKQIKPAAACSDADFLRRVSLDLAGRVPTVRETTLLLEDKSPDKRQQAIRRLMSGPEYSLHLGRVLDDSMQGKYAGDPDFLEYLRSSLVEHKSWDKMFREIMLGPWDTKESKRADRFLVRRLTSLDDLTNDTARVFFGVNISCAKCHDHPLVQDWKQDHYYGLASFFNRTQGAKNAMAVMEKNNGDVQFVTTKGERKTAKLMFLSGKVIDEPAAKSGQPAFSRREQIVNIALEEKQFFSRAMVNRLWAYFMGRGLVHPIDQMHSANPPSIPDLLEWLADDFADNGYDIDRLVAAIVSTRVYQQTSLKSGDDSPPPDQFARAALRPLTPYQYAMSLALVTGDASYEQLDPASRQRKFRELEGQFGRIVKAELLDRATDRYQASTNEALYISNHPDVQKLVVPMGNNLLARLVTLTDNKQAVETAIETILSRPADTEEREYLVKWLEQHKQDRVKALGEMVWALMTSAEFRFNH
jgi:Protein of unknown function (DUF1549)/Protein of unknown function (DUF1553)